jgi:hypothetical protein
MHALNIDFNSIEITEALEKYFSAARRFNALIEQQCQVADGVVREYAFWAMMVLYTYRLPSNWTHDKQPRVPIPVELTDDIARNIQMVLSGHIPKWMLHIRKAGAPPAHSRMIEDIGVAVAYKKLADAGQIKDRHSTKTITEAYGVTPKAVQNWMKEYSYAEPTDFFPAAAGDEERAMAIAEQLPKSGDFYRKWGRSPKTQRPFGKARRRPSAKS